MPDPADAHVTLAEVARIAGVGRAAVSNWRRRHDTFPAPVGGSDTSPQFSLTEVDQWLRRNGKVEGAGSRERLWPEFEALGDRTLVGLAVAEIGRRVLAGDAIMPWPAGAELPEDAQRLIDRTVESTRKSGDQDIFEFLLARWLDTHVRQISTTPALLAELMAVIADVFSCKSGVPESVLDPACGAGGLLIAAARQWPAADRAPRAVLAGADRDLALASLAAARLGFARAEHGGSLRGGRAAGAGAHIAGVDVRVGDSLRADPHEEFRADLVLCNPPFNERDWGHEELATDPRWTYGLPPRTEPELAWVEHALARLKPGGVAVLLLPPAVASRRAGRRIRGALLRAGAIQGVIALPPGTAAPYSVSLHLWVLQAPAPTATAATRRDVLLVDAAASGPRSSGGPQGIDWPELREHAVAAVRAYVARSKSKANGRSRPTAVLPAGCVAVPVMDLLDEQVDLTPARYVPGAGASDGVQLRDSWPQFEDLLHTLSELADLLSRFDLAGEHGTPVTTTVGDLDRAQALTVHAGRDTSAGLTRLSAPSEGAVPMLTVPDLLSGGKPGSWVPADQVSRAGGALTLAEANDVVVVGVERAYRAWVHTDGPVVLGPQLYLLRVDPALLDPWFVAGCLRAPANARQASTHTSSSSRIDVRKLQVLQLLLAEQRRYARAFQQLAAMEETLLNVQVVGAGLLRSLSNGLAAGQLKREAAGSAN